ncbi:MAG: HEAT repeat domain-containing protein [Candidatus Eisenbacteria bacterium]|nr:HEAT repeat domain-containing protein [Candidatus Eisenbacteria bacterium]
MKRDDVRKKRAHVDELVRARGAEAIPALTELLGHESWTLRESAAKALTAMGQDAVSAVLPLARSGLWYSRAGAARVLGAVGGSECLAVLLDMLLEENRTVSESAASALVHVCRRGGVTSVARGVYARSPSDREPALRLLEAGEAGLEEKVRRLLADTQLMTVREDGSELWEQGDTGRKGGLVWEVLTGGKAQPPEAVR